MIVFHDGMCMIDYQSSTYHYTTLNTSFCEMEVIALTLSHEGVLFGPSPTQQHIQRNKTEHSKNCLVRNSNFHWMLLEKYHRDHLCDTTNSHQVPFHHLLFLFIMWLSGHLNFCPFPLLSSYSTHLPLFPFTCQFGDLPFSISTLLVSMKVDHSTGLDILDFFSLPITYSAQWRPEETAHYTAQHSEGFETPTPICVGLFHLLYPMSQKVQVWNIWKSA